MDVGSFPHQVTRLVFDTGQPYDQFRARYEAAVPALDEKHLAGFAARGAAWPEVVADAGASAPHGFLIFWRLDTTPSMARWLSLVDAEITVLEPDELRQAFAELAKRAARAAQSGPGEPAPERLKCGSKSQV